MKKIFYILIVAGVLQISVLAQNAQIEETRRLYDQTNRIIKNAERAFAKVKPEDDAADTEIYLTEVYFNKGKTIYPGTGPFRTETKFFFTMGDGAERFVGKLLKIVRITRDLGEVRYEEWLYNAKGELIFYFENPDLENTDPESLERRIYFSGGKMIRYQVGDKTQGNSPLFQNKTEIVQEVLDESKKLQSVFKNSM